MNNLNEDSGSFHLNLLIVCNHTKNELMNVVVREEGWTHFTTKRFKNNHYAIYMSWANTLAWVQRIPTYRYVEIQSENSTIERKISTKGFGLKQFFLLSLRGEQSPSHLHLV